MQPRAGRVNRLATGSTKGLQTGPESRAAVDRGPLFEPDFLRKLERLELLARKVLRGWSRGDHVTSGRGRGLELTDFRRYQSGDDLRYIDWNIFSRLDQLFLKLHANEEDVTLHIALDASASMGFGSPTKFDYARQVAAALAYIGLNSLDRVGVTVFGENLSASLPPRKSRAQISTVLSFLSDLECGGGTEFTTSLTAQSGRMTNPGLIIVLSDLLGDRGAQDGIDALRYRGHDVVVLQLLAEEEIEPPLDGALRLIDAEDNSTLRVTVDGPLRRIYRERLRFELESFERYARRAGIEYMRVSTAIPIQDLLLRYLRQGRHWR